MPTNVAQAPLSGNGNRLHRRPRPDRSNRYDFEDVYHRVLSRNELEAESPAESPDEPVEPPQPAAAEPVPTETPQRQYPPSIPQLQSFFGMRNGVSPRLRQICKTGDQALILNQLLCYWYGRSGEQNQIRARIMKRVGARRERFVAKSHEQWADELGMTKKQARTAIAGLKQLGFIQAIVRKFNRRPTLHVRPLRRPIAEACGCPDDQPPYRRRRRPRRPLTELECQMRGVTYYPPNERWR